MKKNINSKDIIKKIINDNSTNGIQSIKASYTLDDHELVEFFIEILLLELDNKDIYLKEQLPDYIYLLLDIINKLCRESFPKNKKNPYVNKYNLAREKIFIINKMLENKKTPNKISEDAVNLMQAIFNEKDIEIALNIIKNNPSTLIYELNNSKIIEYIFNEYFISEVSEDNKKCKYYNSLLLRIIDELRKMDIYPNNIKKFVKSVQGIEIINDKNLDTGTLRLTLDGGVVNTKNNGEVYIPSKYITKRIDNIEVTIEVINYKNKSIGKIIKYKNKMVKKIGKIINVEGKPYILINNEIYPYNSKKYKVNDNVLVNILNDNEEIEVVKNVKVKNDIELKINQILINNNIDNEFSKESLYQAKLLKEIGIKNSEDRKDLTSELIFTIDGKDTKDIDDAVSIKLIDNDKYLLSVHIADVTNYVKEFSPLDIDAKNKGTSTYLGNKVIPMLPEILSNKLCSLQPNEKRLTITVEMLIDKNGNVNNTNIYPSIIKSNKKMTYDEVNDVLANKYVRGYKKYKENLNLMQQLSNILEDKSKINGSVQMYSDEIKFSFNSEGYPIGISKRECGDSENIIKNFMIITNVEVAKFISGYNLPTPYRVHKAASDYALIDAINNINKLGYDFEFPKFNNKINHQVISQILLQAVNTEHEELVSNELVKAFSKAYYTLEELGHFALNVDKYSHFTSPIRRYPDIIAHRQIKEIIKLNNNEKLDYILMDSYESDLKKCSEREIKSNNCEKAVEKLYSCYYMKEEVNNDLLAKIVEVNNNGIKIKFLNGISARISSNELSEYYYDKEARRYIHQDYEPLVYGKQAEFNISYINFNDLKIICTPVNNYVKNNSKVLTKSKSVQ